MELSRRVIPSNPLHDGPCEEDDRAPPTCGASGTFVFPELQFQLHGQKATNPAGCKPFSLRAD